MKKILTASLLLLIAFSACSKGGDKKPQIAIVTPITHPSLQQIEKGFIQTMEENNPGKYTYVTYNAQGNKTLMRSEIEEISKSQAALVFTIGTSASQMVKQVFENKEHRIPVVFTCVNDPIGFQIVRSEENPEGMVTGVKEMLSLEEEIATLLSYKPSIQNLTLVYNPAEPGLEKDKEDIERITVIKGITLKAIEVFQANEMKAKVSPFMGQSDALIVLKDNTVVTGLDVLVKLCNQYQIPLMASDLDSPDRGAALGYGVYEEEFGIEGAKKAHLILDQGLKPSQIPVTPVARFALRVNREAAEKQGIKVEEKGL